MKYVGIDDLKFFGDYNSGWGIWNLELNDGKYCFLDDKTLKPVREFNDDEPLSNYYANGFGNVLIRDVFEHRLLWIV